MRPSVPELLVAAALSCRVAYSQHGAACTVPPAYLQPKKGVAVLRALSQQKKVGLQMPKFLLALIAGGVAILIMAFLFALAVGRTPAELTIWHRAGFDCHCYASGRDEARNLLFRYGNN
jgi:hypothetical protein